jgi:hypothetical protein
MIPHAPGGMPGLGQRACTRGVFGGRKNVHPPVFFKSLLVGLAPTPTPAPSHEKNQTHSRWGAVPAIPHTRARTPKHTFKTTKRSYSPPSPPPPPPRPLASSTFAAFFAIAVSASAAPVPAARTPKTARDSPSRLMRGMEAYAFFSEHARRQGQDLHQPPTPQLVRGETQDARAQRRALCVDEHARVAGKGDGAPVRAAQLLDGLGDDGFLDLRGDWVFVCVGGGGREEGGGGLAARAAPGRRRRQERKRKKTQRARFTPPLLTLPRAMPTPSPHPVIQGEQDCFRAHGSARATSFLPPPPAGNRRTANKNPSPPHHPPHPTPNKLTVPAATLLRGWARLMATVMMSPMPHDLPDWLMHCATLAPELSDTVRKVPLPIMCVGEERAGAL